jgi:hypothetical protein
MREAYGTVGDGLPAVLNGFLIPQQSGRGQLRGAWYDAYETAGDRMTGGRVVKTGSCGGKAGSGVPEAGRRGAEARSFGGKAWRRGVVSIRSLFEASRYETVAASGPSPTVSKASCEALRSRRGLLTGAVCGRSLFEAPCMTLMKQPEAAAGGG